VLHLFLIDLNFDSVLLNNLI